MSAEQNPLQRPAAQPGQIGGATLIKPFSIRTHAGRLDDFASGCRCRDKLFQRRFELFAVSVGQGRQSKSRYCQRRVDRLGRQSGNGRLDRRVLPVDSSCVSKPAGAGAGGLRYTPGWAVGWLFVPFANLVVPYFVFTEIWRNSIPATADGTKANPNAVRRC